MKNYKEIMEAAKKNPLFNKYAEETRVKMAVADQIFYARKKAGMSQEGLMKITGISQRIISNIENGEYEPGVCLLSRIAKALDLPFLLGDGNLVAGKAMILRCCEKNEEADTFKTVVGKEKESIQEISTQVFRVSSASFR